MRQPAALTLPVCFASAELPAVPSAWGQILLPVWVQASLPASVQVLFLASALILLPASAQALPPASVRQQIVVGQVFVQASLPACHWRSWLAFPASPTFLSLQVFLFVPVHYEVQGRCDGDLDSLKGKVQVTWLLHLVRADILYKNGKMKWRLRFAWIKKGNTGAAAETS